MALELNADRDVSAHN